VPRDQAELPLGEVLDFLRLIWSLDHALQTLSKRMLGTIGVTGPQRLLLRIAARFPGATAGDLASAMRLDRSTVSGILKRLEQRGLLQRRSDPRDGRRTLVFLTARGRDLAGEQSGTVESVVERVLAGLSPKELTAARLALGLLAAAVETDATAAPAS
jgi:DNA-binding MarR family transcriptional regulator